MGKAYIAFRYRAGRNWAKRKEVQISITMLHREFCVTFHDAEGRR